MTAGNGLPDDSPTAGSTQEGQVVRRPDGVGDELVEAIGKLSEGFNTSSGRGATCTGSTS